MGRRGALDWQVINIPLSAGMETKQDPRFSSPPNLDLARDLQFEQVGGVQTRPPFVAFSNSILGGGALANCRRPVVINGELCVFTDTQLYSWNAQLGVWVSRGAHMAVKAVETPRFVTSGDQVDGDRAELNGTIVYAWTEGAGAAASVYAAAMDKTTGSVLAAPTAISPAATFAGRPRVVALATRILLFTDDGGGNLTVRAIDPASPAAGFASAPTNVLAAVFLGKYDVVRVDGADQCVGVCNRNPMTSYTAFTVTAGLAIATSTKARTADGPLAVATITGGAQSQVIRGNGTNVQGDLLTTSTLADVFTGQAIGTVVGTPINQIAVAFSGSTATVFWDSLETTGSGNASFSTKTNTVTTANVVGTQATLVLRLGIASRAFAYSGNVYVWLVFAEQSANSGTGVGLGIRAQLQNTYILYRGDGHIAGKSTFQVAGGYSPSAGHLPGVAVTSGGGADFAWLGAFRRRIDIGGSEHTGYAARSPMDIAFSFDSDTARRTARIGKTLYIAGSLVQQYDGVGIAEVGFFNYPWSFATQDSGVAGNVAAGTYSWKSTWKWTNGVGETERSTTATGEQLTLAASHFVLLSYFNLFVTKKAAPRAPSVEVWRTPAGAANDAPFYLVTGQDPGVVTGDNCYIPNDVTTTGGVLNDNFSDATLATKEKNPENGGVLESLSPPGANIIIATDTRVMLAGVSGDPDAVWYSRLRNEGEIASFHDGNRALVPRDGGDITAAWFQDEVLYVGRQYAIYALPGVGFDNTGAGQNFGPARIVSPDVGPVSQEAQALTPIGTVFKSAKGWQLLDRGGQVHYIGGPVSAFDSDTVLAMHVISARHQVRILTSARLLLWDYRGAVDATAPDPGGQWAEWTISDGLGAVIWNGTYVYLTATGPKQESAAFSSLTYGLDAETSWIKFGDLQGFAKVGETMVLGEYRSPCLVRFRAARDYQYDGAGNPVYFDDRAWPATPAVVGSALQVRYTPKLSLCEAFKLRITAVTDAVRATLVTTALSPQVATSGTAWAATWQAAASSPGLMGNSLSMSLAFEDSAGAAFSIDVRDHFAWNHALQRWLESLGTVGARVLCRTGSSPTVAQLEAAIAAGSLLVTLSAADGTPSKVVSASGMANLTSAAPLSGGAYGSPTGEALRLTALAMKVGIEQGQLYGRLPAAQKV